MFNEYWAEQASIDMGQSSVFMPSFLGSARVDGTDVMQQQKNVAGVGLLIAGVMVFSSNQLHQDYRGMSLHLPVIEQSTQLLNNSTHVRTTQSMVAGLKEKGMPIAAIAEVVHVERKTVYSWLDNGVEASRGNNFDRLVALESVFASEAVGSLRFYHRFWERKANGKQTLKEVLIAEDIDEDAARGIVTALRPTVQQAMRSGARRKAESASPASHLTSYLHAVTVDGV